MAVNSICYYQSLKTSSKLHIGQIEDLFTRGQGELSSSRTEKSLEKAASNTIIHVTRQMVQLA